MLIVWQCSSLGFNGAAVRFFCGLGVLGGLALVQMCSLIEIYGTKKLPGFGDRIKPSHS